MEPTKRDTTLATTQTNQTSEQDRSWEQHSERGRGGTTFQQVKSTVADKLQAAAQTLHQKAARPGQSHEVSNFEHRAAGWLERSADYVNEMEPERVKADIESKVRRNPGTSLLIAGAVGLLLGGLLRRR